MLLHVGNLNGERVNAEVLIGSLSLYIFTYLLNLLFLNCTREEKEILILLQNKDCHCITFQAQSMQAHHHTKIICSLC